MIIRKKLAQISFKVILFYFKQHKLFKNVNGFETFVTQVFNPYSTGNYVWLAIQHEKTGNLHGHYKANAKLPNAKYIPLAHVGSLRPCVAILDTDMLV